jgi:hypothetical protein
MKKYWILAVALGLVAVGFILNYSGIDTLGSGKFAQDYFAAGDFAMGVFAAGTFAIGVFSIGIFSIGIFSIGIFNISLWGIGIFVIAWKRRSIVEKINERDGEDCKE